MRREGFDEPSVAPGHNRHRAHDPLEAFLRRHFKARGLMGEANKTATGAGAMRLGAMQCPADATVFNADIVGAKDLYASRTCQGKAAHANGDKPADLADGAAQARTNAPPTKCALEWFAEVVGITPGDLVLDWGAGCGTNLGYLKRRSGIVALGQDLGSPSMQWARTNGFVDKVCTRSVGRWVGGRVVG